MKTLEKGVGGENQGQNPTHGYHDTNILKKLKWIKFMVTI
jgi:hypothetical protein